MKILHIGYPKTGTTFLQTRIFGPLYLEGRIPAYVGNDGTGRRHRKDPLFLAIKDLGSDYLNSDPGEGRIRFFLDRHPDFLVSIEEVVSYFTDDLESFSDRLVRQFASDTEILITVRQFDTYFSSYYQEKVKGDFVTSPEDAFFPTGDPDKSAIRKTPYPNFRKYDLDGLVNALLRNFEKVTLLDLRLPGYLSWFADRSGIAIEELEKLIESKAKTKRGTNESLSPGWVRFLELGNKVLIKTCLLFGVSGGFYRPSRREIRSAKLSDLPRLLVMIGVSIVKVNLKRLAIALASVRLITRNKYQLPMEISDKILSLIPESAVLRQVQEAGGAITLTADLGKGGSRVTQRIWDNTNQLGL